MKRRFKYGFCRDFAFPPFGFRFWGPWGSQLWRFGFPRREEYLRMLEEYKGELEDMQRQIAAELEEVEREIGELGRK